MNNTEVIKDIKKNQGGAPGSGKQTTGVELDAPYGKFHVGGDLDLVDHIGMRADQLSAMLLLIHGEGMEYFTNMNNNARQSYLWLAYQISSEIEQMLPSLTIREGVAA